MSQPALPPIPAVGRYLTFAALPGFEPSLARELLQGPWPAGCVVGLGAPLVLALGGKVPGLRLLGPHAGPGVSTPSTPGALWVWLRGDDLGELMHSARHLLDHLSPVFELVERVDAFNHRGGRDLSGYEDGTENPTGEAADAALWVRDQGVGLDGACFASVMVWEHDFVALDAMAPPARDAMIGRRISDNVELEDAPPSAHVRRTAQESFSPPAFVVRRSMPFVDGERAGLVFVAFAASLDPFEAQLARMVGAEDGVVDGLFQFSRPVTGAHYWCPPTLPGGGLDLRAVGA